MKSTFLLILVVIFASSCEKPEAQSANDLTKKQIEGRWFLNSILVDNERDSKDLTEDWKAINYEFNSDGTVNIYVGDKLRKTQTWTYLSETNELHFLDLFNTPFLSEVISVNNKSLILESMAVIEGTNTAKKAQYYFGK